MRIPLFAVERSRNANLRSHESIRQHEFIECKA